MVNAPKLDPNGLCDVKSGSLFWQIVHDGIAHPLLVLGFYCKLVVKFHDYTSFKAWPLGVYGTNRLERNVEIWVCEADKDGDEIWAKGSTLGEAKANLEINIKKAKAWASDDPIEDWNRATYIKKEE